MMLTRMTRTTTHHLSDEEFVDLVRGQGERRPKAQQHVLGCDACSRRERMWGAVRHAAVRETAYVPPASAVQQARAHYALHGPKSFFVRAAHAAKLLFDSQREPLAAGVRAGAPPARLLLYGKAGRLLKLRVEGQVDSEAFCLVGQVVDERAPERKMQDLPVLIQSGSRTVTRTLTNQSGEFALELQSAADVRLVIGMPGPEAMVVALPVNVAVEEER